MESNQFRELMGELVANEKRRFWRDTARGAIGVMIMCVFFFIMTQHQLGLVLAKLTPTQTPPMNSNHVNIGRETTTSDLAKQILKKRGEIEE